MKTRNFSVALWLLVLSVFVLPSQAQSTFYVSPSGNDANAGTLAKPFKTLAKVRAYLRPILPRMQGDVKVILRGGTYSVPSGWVLDSADGGKNGKRVLYQAYGGETPVVSGGVAITGWVLHDSAKNIWKASVGASKDFRQLYVNGVRCYRAWTTTNLTTGYTRTSTGYTQADSYMSTWGNQSDIEFWYQSSWRWLMVPVQNVVSNTITMQTPAWTWATVGSPMGPRLSRPLVWSSYHTLGPSTENPKRIVNAYEILSATTFGQFYLNRSQGIVYYVPRIGENLASATVTYPGTDFVLRLKGTAANPVKNLTFSGITFAEGGWSIPRDGSGFVQQQEDSYATQEAIDAQGTQTAFCYGTMPANVSFEYARNCRLERGAIKRMGTTGISLRDGTKNCSIVGVEITDCSGNGISVAKNLDWNASGEYLCESNVISNCHIYDIAKEFYGSVGIKNWYSKGNIIEYNDVHDTPYMTISLAIGGGSYTRKPNSNLNNIVRFNRCWNAMKTAANGGVSLIDGGFIYSNGTNDGLLVFGNVCYGLQATTPAALYLDQGAENQTWIHNVTYGNTPETLYLHLVYNTNVVKYNFVDVARIKDTPDFEAGYVPYTLGAELNQVVPAGLYPPTILKKAGRRPEYGGIVYSATPAPGVPVAMGRGEISDYKVTLYWSPPTVTGTGGIRGYEIYLNGGEFPIAVSNTNKYTFRGLKPSSTFTFEFAAWDENLIVGRRSAPITVITPSTLVAQPSGNFWQIGAEK